MALDLEDAQALVLLLQRQRREIEDLRSRVETLESMPQRISFGGGARNFSQLQGTIADTQTPNTLLLDGSRAMTGNLVVGDSYYLGYSAVTFKKHDGSTIKVWKPAASTEGDIVIRNQIAKAQIQTPLLRSYGTDNYIQCHAAGKSWILQSFDTVNHLRIKDGVMSLLSALDCNSQALNSVGGATMTGNLDLDTGNKLIFGDIELFRESSDYLRLTGSGGVGYRDLRCRNVCATGTAEFYIMEGFGDCGVRTDNNVTKQMVFSSYTAGGYVPHLKMLNGVMSLQSALDCNSQNLTDVANANFNGATIKMTNLPVADPHVVGQLWNNGGVLTVSAG